MKVLELSPITLKRKTTAAASRQHESGRAERLWKVSPPCRARRSWRRRRHVGAFCISCKKAVVREMQKKLLLAGGIEAAIGTLYTDYKALEFVSNPRAKKTHGLPATLPGRIYGDSLLPERVQFQTHIGKWGGQDLPSSLLVIPKAKEGREAPGQARSRQ